MPPSGTGATSLRPSKTNFYTRGLPKRGERHHSSAMATVITHNGGVRSNTASASDTRAFLERCAPGRLLSLAVGANGELQGLSPSLYAALGGSPDAARLARLIQGAEPGFIVVANLQLSDGTRVIGFNENPSGRIERQLKQFAEAHRLSAAERVALTDIAAGASAKDSADRLGLSAETIRARRKRIFRKVGADGCGSILAMLLKE